MYKNILWNFDWQCEHMTSSVIVHRVIQGAYRSSIKAIDWSIRPGLDGAISSARLHQLKKWVRWVVLIPHYGPRFFENSALVEITNWRELTFNHSRCSWHNLVDSGTVGDKSMVTVISGVQTNHMMKKMKRIKHWSSKAFLKIVGATTAIN